MMSQCPKKNQQISHLCMFFSRRWLHHKWWFHKGDFLFMLFLFQHVLRLPSLKLTFSPLKMDGWNTILSYWVLAYFQVLLLMAEIPNNYRLDVWNPINNGINYQPQLDFSPDFSHQQYVSFEVFIKKITSETFFFSWLAPARQFGSHRFSRMGWGWTQWGFVVEDRDH